MNIDEIFSKFETTPYLFVGSGLSRRYLGLPNWNDLLEHFCSKVSENALKYTQLRIETNNDYPKIGQIINEEFNKRWFEDQSMRSDSAIIAEQVKQLCSPFKAEIAGFIKSQTQFKEEYYHEIDALKRILGKHVSGVVTTNYDKLIETVAPQYTVYSSQNELIASRLYGIGELYKIHGDVDKPETIVITEKDYQEFDKKYKYLAAKLLTIFSEFPVVFIGYSLSDNNVRKILQEMAFCFPEEGLESLSGRLVVISYKENEQCRSYRQNMDFGQYAIPMTVVETNNFLQIYQTLEKKKSGYPVHILRSFQKEIYDYVVTGSTTQKCVVQPYDESMSEESIIFSIGVRKDENGLIGVDSSDWYRDVIEDTFKDYPPESYFTIVYPRLMKVNLALPVFKLLAKTSNVFDYSVIDVPSGFEDLLLKSEKSVYDRLPKKYVQRSIKCIENHPKKVKKETEFLYITYLREDEYDVNYLESYLKRQLKENFEYLKNPSFKRLIRIYDWLKYRPIFLSRHNNCS